MSTLDEIARDEAKLELTPMIDVTFLLLIFFLCTLEFKVLEGKLAAYLPRGSGPSETPTETLDIGVDVHHSGTRVFATGTERGLPWQGESGRRFEFVGRELVYRVGPRRTTRIRDVAEWLAAFHDRDPTTRTTIDCGPGTVYADVLPVLDELMDAGFSRIDFARE